MSWAASAWKEGLPALAVQKINQLEDHVEKLQKSNQQKQLQFEQLEQALNKQKQKAEEGRSEETKLSRSLQTLEESHLELQEKYHKLQQELQIKEVTLKENFLNQSSKLHIQENNETHSNKNVCDASEIATLKATIEKLQAENQELKFSKLKSPMKGSFSSGDITDKIITPARGRMNRDDDQIERIKAAKNAAEDKAVQLEQKLRQVTKELECQRHNSEAAKAALEQKYKTKELEFKEEMKEHTQNVTRVEKELNDCRNKLQQSQSQAKTIDTLKAQLEKETQLHLAKTAEIKRLESCMWDLEKNVQGLETQLGELRKVLHNNEKTSDALSSRLDCSEAQKKDISNSVKTLELTLSIKEAELGKTIESLAEKEKMLTHIKQQNNVLEQRCTTLENELRVKVCALEKQLQDSSTHVAKLQKELEEANCYQKQMQLLKEKCSNMEFCLSEKQAAFAKVNKDYESVKANLESKDKILEETRQQLNDERNELQKRTAEVKQQHGDAERTNRALSEQQNLVKQLEGKVTEATNRCQEKETRTKILEEELADRESTLQKVNKDLAEVTRNLTNQSAVSKKQLEEECSKSRDLLEKLEKTRFDLTELKAEFATRKEEFCKREKELQSVKGDLQGKINEVKDLEKKVVSLTEVSQEKEEKLKYAVDEKSAIQTEFAKVKRDLDEEIRQTRVKLEAESSRCQHHEAKAKQMESEVDKMKLKATDMKEEISFLEKEMEMLKSDLKERESSIEQLEKKLLDVTEADKGKENCISNLQRDLEALTKELAEAKATIENKNSTLKQLEIDNNKIIEMKSQLEQMEKQTAELNEERKKVEGKEHELLTCQEELKAKIDDNKELERKVIDLMELKDDMEQKLKSAVSELNTTREKLVETKTKLDNQTNCLKTLEDENLEARRLKETFVKMHSEIDELKSQIEKEKQYLDERDVIISGLKKELETDNRKITEMRSQLEQMEKQTAELNEERKNVEGKEHELLTCQEELKDKIDDNKELERKVINLMELKVDMEQKLKNTVSELDITREELVETKTRLDNQTNCLKTLEDENLEARHLKETFGKMNSEIDELKNQVEKEKQYLDEKDDIISGLNKELEICKQDNECKGTKIEELFANLSDALSGCDDKEKRIESLLKNVACLETKNTENEICVKELEEKAVTMEQQLLSAKMEVDRCTTEQEVLQAKLGNVQSEVDVIVKDLKEELNLKVKELENKEKSSQECQAMLEKCQKELLEKNENFDKVQKELQEKKEALELAQVDLATAWENLENEKASKLQFKDELFTMHSEVQGLMEESSAKNKDMEVRFQEVYDKQQDLKDQIEFATQENEIMKTNLQEETEKNLALESQVVEFEGEQNKLKTELEYLKQELSDKEEIQSKYEDLLKERDNLKNVIDKMKRELEAARHNIRTSEEKLPSYAKVLDLVEQEFSIPGSCKDCERLSEKEAEMQNVLEIQNVKFEQLKQELELARNEYRDQSCCSPRKDSIKLEMESWQHQAFESFDSSLETSDRENKSQIMPDLSKKIEELSEIRFSLCSLLEKYCDSWEHIKECNEGSASSAVLLLRLEEALKKKSSGINISDITTDDSSTMDALIQSLQAALTNSTRKLNLVKIQIQSTRERVEGSSSVGKPEGSDVEPVNVLSSLSTIETVEGELNKLQSLFNELKNLQVQQSKDTERITEEFLQAKECISKLSEDRNELQKCLDLEKTAHNSLIHEAIVLKVRLTEMETKPEGSGENCSLKNEVQRLRNVEKSLLEDAKRSSETIEQLNLAIEEVESNLQDVFQENNELKQKLDGLLTEKNTLQESLTEKLADCQKQLLVATCKMDSLEERNKEIESDLNDFLDRELKLEEMEAKNLDLEHRIEELSANVENERQQFSKVLNQSKSENEVLSEHVKEVDNKNLVLERKIVELSTYSEECQHYTEKLMQVQAENKDLSNQLQQAATKFDEDVKELKVKIEQLNQENLELVQRLVTKEENEKNMIDEIKAQLRVVYIKVQELETQNQSLKTDKEDILSHLELVKNEHNECQEENRQLKKQMKGLQENMVLVEEGAKELEKEVQQLDELRAEKNQLTKLVIAMKDKVRTFENLQEELTLLNNTVILLKDIMKEKKQFGSDSKLLKDRFSDLEVVIQDVKEACSDISTELLEKLRSDIASLNEIYFSLKSETNKLPETNSESLLSDIKSLKEEKRELQTCLDDLKQECESITNTIEKGKEDLVILENTMSQLRVAIEDEERLKNENCTLTEKIFGLEKALQVATEASLKNSVDSQVLEKLTNDITALNEVNFNLKNERDELLKTNDSVSDLLLEIGNLKKQKLELQSCIDSLQSENNTNKDTIEKMHKEISDIKKSFAEQSEEITNTIREMELLQNQYDAKCVEMFEKEALIVEFRSIEEQLRGVLSEVTEKCTQSEASLKEHIHALDDKVACNRREMEELKEEAKTFVEKICEVTNEKEVKEKELAVALERVAELESQIDKSTTEGETEAMDFLEKLQILEEVINAKTSDCSRLVEKVNTMENKIVELNEKLCNLKEAFDAKEKIKVAELTVKIEDLTKDKTEMHGKILLSSNMLKRSEKERQQLKRECKKMHQRLEGLKLETSTSTCKCNTKIKELETEKGCLQREIEVKEENILKVWQEHSSLTRHLIGLKEENKKLKMGLNKNEGGSLSHQVEPQSPRRRLRSCTKENLTLPEHLIGDTSESKRQISQTCKAPKLSKESEEREQEKFCKTKPKKRTSSEYNSSSSKKSKVVDSPKKCVTARRKSPRTHVLQNVNSNYTVSSKGSEENTSATPTTAVNDCPTQ